MNKDIGSILKEVLERAKPPKEDLKFIEETLDNFLKDLKDRIKKSKIKVEVFVGGSFAKKTVIKKDNYDADVFLRFDKKYPDEELSILTEKILKGVKSVELIHGSRDYFRVMLRKDFFIELVPVKKVSNPRESNNITDLSYSHVKYIQNKVKSEKMLDEIRIAKAFCYASRCYGAESYIQGFSGYAIELLVYYYGSFLKFIKAIVKIKDKEVIDIEKSHKNKGAVLMNINAAKLASPIILIDPTFKQRNALAALSNETFQKFQKACKEFLSKPSVHAFEIKKIDIGKIKENAKKNKFEFVLLILETEKQRGDIAGSKLLKFFNHLGDEISRYFDIKHNGFNYSGKKSALGYFAVKSKKEILIEGPFIKDKESVAAFKKRHKNTIAKKERVYAKDKINFDIKKFISDWKAKNHQKMSDMSISGLRII